MNPEYQPEDVGRFYDKQADSFDSFAFNSPYWETHERPCIVRNLEGLLDSSTRIVDLACGSGRLSNTLIDMGAKPQNIVGVDMSRELLKKASQRIPDGNFVLGDISDLGIKPESIDLAVSSMAFQYLDNDSLQRTLDSASIYLKKGGKIFFLATHPFDSADFNPNLYGTGWFLTKTPWGELTPNFRGTVGGYITALHRAGFQIENMDEVSRSRGENHEELFRIAIKGVKEAS